MGHTAIAEIQFADYIFPAFDQVSDTLVMRTVSCSCRQLRDRLSMRPRSTDSGLVVNLESAR